MTYIAKIISGRGSGKYPDRWAVIREIRRRYSEGEPVNYSAIRHEDDALRRRSTALFGGYKYAVEEAGFDYETFRVDTNTASYCGILFEEVVKELFDEMQMERIKYEGGNLEPDIVLRHSRWIDVKLSEWTITNRDCETVERYLPKCRSLSVVYMRGREGERMYDGKVRLMHVNEIIKQLPRGRRGIFYGKIADIGRRLDEIETPNKKTLAS